MSVLLQLSNRPAGINRSVRRRALVVALVMCATTRALAQTNITWNVNSGGAWDTSGNWSPANVPNLATEVAIFNQSNGGTITWASNLAVGGITFNSSAGAFTISRTSGATRTLTLGQYGIAHNDDSTQTLTGSSMRLTLGAAASFAVNSTGNLVISTTGNSIATTGTNKLTLTGNGTGIGSISSQITGAGLLTKNGSGTWRLSGNNSYTGGTEIVAGVLAADSANALGASGTIDFSGGTLQYGSGITTDFSARIGNSASAVKIDTNGNNVTFGSALANTNTGGLTKSGTGTLTLSGNNAYTGTTTLEGGTVVANHANALSTAGNITFTGGTLQYGTGITTDYSARLANSTSAIAIDTNSNNVTFASNIANTNTGGLTKLGAGTLTLSGNNAYTGTTTLAAGTIVANHANALSTAGNITFTGGTLQYGTGITTDYSARIAGSTSAIAINTNGNNVTFGSSIAGTNTAGLAKTGAGTLTLNTANNYSGTTSIDGGALNIRDGGALSSGAVSVNTGGTLEIQGGGVNAANNITLAGGTLRNVSGDLNWLSGAVTVADNSTITSATLNDRLYVGDTGNAIDLGTNTLTIDGAGKTILIGAVGAGGEAGNIVINSTSDVWFNSQGLVNNYTGSTTVNSGTLVLGTNNHVSFNNTTIRGALTIGNGTDTAAVRYETGYGIEKISDSSAVTINRFGTLNLNSSYDTIGALTLNGGAVTLGSGGTLVLSGDVVVGSSADTSTISGYQLWLTPSAGARTFTVANGAQSSDLLITATVASGGIIKSGTGTMTLAGDNSYTEATTISQGILNIRSNTGLGSSTNGTSVTSGAALELQRDASYNGGNIIAIASEAITLNGTGSSVDTGALRNIYGDNTIGGVITLGSAARINSDSYDHDNNIGTAPLISTLTLNGSISGAHNLTVGGASNTWINGAIGTSTGTLTKDGAGTLTLTGNNNFSGATTISAGVVNVRHNYGLGSTAGGVTVASGAALQLEADASYNGGLPVSVGSEALSLSGTGVSNDGALRNIAGNNTYGGAITVASASARINSDSGTLTLTNTVALGTNTLTVGGASNTTISGQMTGAAASILVKDGAGTLTLSNTTNTFSGNVDIDAGTLAFGANNALNSTSIDVNIDSGATMSLVTYAQNIGTLAGLGALDFGTSGKITITGDSTFSGSFTGTGEIVVSAGSTLRLGADFNASGVTITLAGGTLDVNGSNSIFGTLKLTGNSVIDFDSAANSTVQFTTLNLGSYGLDVTGWVDLQDYFLATNQPGTMGSPPLNQVTFAPSGPWTGANTTWQSWDKQVTPVPEPSTYGALLLAFGLAGFGYRRWRQAK